MPISTFKLVGHFSARPGFEVHAVLPSDGEMAQRLRPLGARVAVIPFVRLRSPARPFGFMLSVLSAVPACFRLAGYLKAHRITIVHFSDIIDLLFYPAARVAGCAVVAHLRLCIERPLMRRLYAVWTSLFADRVICISEACRTFSGLRGGKAVTVYNPGPDPRLFDPSLPHAVPDALDTGKLNVCAIGKFVEVKGHHNFVGMAARVEAQQPGLARYFILGSKVRYHERYFDFVMRRVSREGLDGKLRVLEPVAHEQMPSILAATHVLVHIPSWQEALGGVILEAMAMKTTVVAYDCGGIGEFLRDGVSGLVVRHRDVEAAATAAARLIRDEGLRKRLGEAGRREMLSKFSYEKHFEAVARVYGELYQRKGADG